MSLFFSLFIGINKILILNILYIKSYSVFKNNNSYLILRPMLLIILFGNNCPTIMHSVELLYLPLRLHWTRFGRLSPHFRWTLLFVLYFVIGFLLIFVLVNFCAYSMISLYTIYTWVVLRLSLISFFLLSSFIGYLVIFHCFMRHYFHITWLFYTFFVALVSPPRYRVGTLECGPLFFIVIV